MFTEEALFEQLVESKQLIFDELKYYRIRGYYYATANFSFKDGRRLIIDTTKELNPSDKNSWYERIHKGEIAITRMSFLPRKPTKPSWL